jgi:RNA polymerase sigma-70 factor (ECF subfamily)
MRKAHSAPSDATANADWTAALRGDRAAFQAIATPHIGEVVKAAGHVLRYRVALGDLRADDLTAEELVGDVLARAWQDRHRRPALLGVKAWLLALLFRTAEDAARRETRFGQLAAVSLEATVPPEPIYDDDESFWEWYQPDEMTRWEDVVAGRSKTPEDGAAADEEFTRSLDPRAREIFLIHEVHGVPLPEAALAFGLSVEEAARLLADAQRRVGIEDGVVV